jgi:hypothetical protein
MRCAFLVAVMFVAMVCPVLFAEEIAPPEGQTPVKFSLSAEPSPSGQFAS